MMSQELLKALVDVIDDLMLRKNLSEDDAINISDSVLMRAENAIESYLAQPEQEPTTRHALDSYWNQEAYQRGYAEAKLKLKRKPITGIEISNGFKADDEAKHPYSYWAGVEFAEKHHGIGGEE